MNINNKITQYEVTTQIARLSPSEMGLSSSAHKAILVSFTQALGYTDRYKKTREYLVTWISNKTVAELSGSKRDTVGKVLNYLEYCGWLKSTANMDNSKDYVWIGVQSVVMTFKEWEQAGKPKACVKKQKAEVKVKEEIKQNPMPTNEPIETLVPLSVDVLEKTSISKTDVVEADTVPHADDSDFARDMRETQSLVEIDDEIPGMEQTEVGDFDDGWGDIPAVNLIEFCKGNVIVKSAYEYHELVSDAIRKNMEISGLCKAKHHNFQPKVIKDEPCPF